MEFYPLNINSDLVSCPPATNCSHCLVHVAEGAIILVASALSMVLFQYFKKKGNSSLPTYASQDHFILVVTSHYSFHSETRGHCSKHAEGMWFRLDQNSNLFTTNHYKSEHP